MAKNRKKIVLEACMELKDNIPVKILYKDYDKIFRSIVDSVLSINKDYPEIEIHIVKPYLLDNVGKIFVAICIDKDFAKENLYFNGKFAPERYLGFYLSRVSRRLKKSNKRLAKYFFKPGMFTYAYSIHYL